MAKAAVGLNKEDAGFPVQKSHGRTDPDVDARKAVATSLLYIFGGNDAGADPGPWIPEVLQNFLKNLTAEQLTSLDERRSPASCIGLSEEQLGRS